MKRLICVLLFLCLLASLTLPVGALTASSYLNEYDLTEGVRETSLKMSGGQAGYMLEIAPNSDVSFKTSYANYFTKGSTVSSRAQAASSLGIQTKTTTSQAADYETATGRDVIFATNGNFFFSDTHETRGFLMVEGTQLQTNSSDCVCYFAITKDGSYDIRDYTEDTSDVYEAVAGRQWLVKNGVQMRQNAEVLSARTAIGLKADGTVVVFVVDGKTNVSGTTINDMSELMYSLGCVEAINLDGGGSSTFASQRAGSDKLVIRNNPSDASGEREVVSTLLLVKTDRLFFDFTDDAAAKERYSQDIYGGLNFDTGNWHYHNTYCTAPAFDSNAGTVSFSTTADCPVNRHIHPIITSSNTSFTGGHPLSYTPSGKDYFKIRMKIENSPDTDISFCLKYAASSGTSSDLTAMSCTIPSASVNNGYFTLEGYADFSGADLVTAIRPEVYNLLIPTPTVTQVTFTIDYIFVGPKHAVETQKALLFDFTNDESAQARYDNLAYGFFNFDQNGTWATTYNGSNSAYTIDPAKGTLTLDVTEGFSGSESAGNMTNGPWLKVTNEQEKLPSVNLPEYQPLLFAPADCEVLQLRFKLSNCTVQDGKKPRIVFEYYYSQDGNRGYNNDIRYQYELENEAYLTITVPLSAAFRNADRIHGFGLRFQHIKSAENGKIELDYIYIGAKESMPLRQYDVTFLGADGNILQTQTVYEGESVIYSGETPRKAYDETNHYSFCSWDKPLTNISSDTVLTAQFSATAHSFTYSNMTECSHSSECACGYGKTAEHSFENGVCACGAVEVTDPIYDDAVKFSHSLTLENDISINFIGLGSALSVYDSFYLECKVPVYDGNELTGYEIVNIEPIYNGKNYEFTLLGVTAKMMNDDIEAVFRMMKGGQEYYSKTDVYSVAEYAYGKLDSTKATDTDELKAICANLLRYGALAQMQFNYRTDALVDTNMTDAHKSYLTDLATVEMKDYRKQLNDLDTVIVPWKSTTLELGNKVIMCLIVNLANYTGDPAELTMRLTYVDSNGLTVTEERPLELYNPDAQTYAVSYDGLRATEMRSIVSAAIYNGDTRVSKTVEYSIESYGARSSDTAMRDLCLAMLAYGDAANAFFSK